MPAFFAQKLFLSACNFQAEFKAAVLLSLFMAGLPHLKRYLKKEASDRGCTVQKRALLHCMLSAAKKR